MIIDYVRCSQCGAKCSQDVAAEGAVGIILRGWVECVKCLKEKPEETKLEAKVTALQNKLDKVLHEAVASQYFGETHKHRAHLYDIMRDIDPEVAKAFDDDPREAYKITAERIGMKL